MDQARAERTPETVYRKDYTPAPYGVEKIELKFDLEPTDTRVTAKAEYRLNPNAKGGDLTLDGHGLALLALRMDDRDLIAGVDFDEIDGGLVLHEPPAQFVLEIVTRINPRDNAALEGLYQSKGVFCTQCEAEGFRRITYFLDRPDVMTVYTTTITADARAYPVLLSNGNLIEQGERDNGRHYAVWHDPFPKPSYLFALVAGDLGCREGSFTTASGREVALRIYSEPHNVDQLDHAMASLRKAMRWDEERFGLEYDLDIYMIVAVEDFNMGAMENKGLNVFNTKCVLARPETATDDDHLGVEAVIAHEYFHNWTGNRVTCRDWFQLSLKEGLTVFRDQEFSADVGSRGVKRIQDVRMLRSAQFPEDAGPMAHPVRPDAYMEINNFYTVTVYEKGAEVVRMYQSLFGRDGFRKGMDLYFQRHDGQAVTCDDFRAAMADANAADLTQFERWYDQAGTPVLEATASFDDAAGTLTLDLRQSCSPTPGQSEKQPFMMPIAIGLMDESGRDVPVRLADETAEPSAGTRVLVLREHEARFVFTGLPHRPVVSLLRDFSAPVKLRFTQDESDLRLRIAHDSDSFNRWEAAQTLYLDVLLRGITALQSGDALPGAQSLAEALDVALAGAQTPQGDKALLAEMLTLPSESYIGDQLGEVDVDAVHRSREALRHGLAEALQSRLGGLYERLADDGPYHFDAQSVARRRLRNRALDLLMTLHDEAWVQRCQQQFETAGNMTDALAALSGLVYHGGDEADAALAAFYERWKQEPLVVDKWFAIQAAVAREDALDHVRELLTHPAFNARNPNKLRALIGTFASANPVGFHRRDGAGYVFLTEQIMTIDGFNPHMAARLTGPLTRWRRYDKRRRAAMREALEAIVAKPDLSRDVYEVASKSLEGAD